MDFSNKSDEEILKIGEPLWDNMVEGYNEENGEIKVFYSLIA